MSGEAIMHHRLKKLRFRASLIPDIPTIEHVRVIPVTGTSPLEQFSLANAVVIAFFQSAQPHADIAGCSPKMSNGGGPLPRSPPPP